LQYLQNPTALDVNSPRDPDTAMPTTENEHASLVAPLMALRTSPPEEHLRKPSANSPPLEAGTSSLSPAPSLLSPPSDLQRDFDAALGGIDNSRTDAAAATTAGDDAAAADPAAADPADSDSDSADSLWDFSPEDIETVVEVPDTEEGKDANIARSLPKLADFCDLSPRELSDIMENEPFTSIFKAIDEAVFQPAREVSIRTQKPRPRMFDLKTVVHTLSVGECHGNQKFSNPQSGEQDGWSSVDHHANFLYKMRQTFYFRKGGFLFGKGLTEDMANQRIWLILKRADAHNAPSRVAKRKNEAHKRKLKGLENDTPGKRRSRAVKKTSRKPSDKNLGGASGDGLPADSDDDYDEDELDMVDPQSIIEDMAVSPGTFDVGDDDDNHVRGSMKLELPPEFRQVANYKYRYWQYAHMRQLTKTYHQAMAVAERMQSGLDNAAAARMDGLGMADGWAQVVEDDATKEHDGEEEDLDGTDDIVCMGQPTVKDLENLAELSKLMNNAKYQRDNIIESMRNLRIKDRRKPRLFRQSLSTPLRWWQIVGINAIVDARKHGKMRGMMLADIVGLGKTFQLAGYMLHVSRFHHLLLKETFRKASQNCSCLLTCS
jgi:hypothetical protein